MDLFRFIRVFGERSDIKIFGHFVLSVVVATSSFVFASAALAENANAWNGPYAGVDIGYGSSTFRNTFHVYEFQTASTGTDNVALSGISGGVHVGYRAAVFSDWVLGVQADALWSGINGSGSAISCPAASCFINNTTVQHDSADSVQTLKATIGYAMGDWLPYATIGGAVGEFRGSGTIGNFLSSTKFSYSKSDGGWLVGGGVEARIDPHLSWKAEYDYLSFAGFSEIAPPGAIGTTGVRIDENLFEIGVNYRF